MNIAIDSFYHWAPRTTAQRRSGPTGGRCGCSRMLARRGLPIGEACRVSVPPRRPDDDEKLVLENLRHQLREMKA